MCFATQDPMDSSPFAGTARYYAQFRPPYAQAAIDYIIATFGLGDGARSLDLGCGPGTIAIPLSRSVAEVVAVEPDAGMMEEGRRLAAERWRMNIQWVQARAENISVDLGRFRAATIGQSFHWMDRDLVLRKLADLIEDGGGLALVNPGKRRPQESWEEAASEIVEKFLGPRRRHPNANPEPEHEPALRRSKHFAGFAAREFPTSINRDVASILGCVYSYSYSARHLFGNDIGTFEAELSETLLKFNPSGIFSEHVETEVILAPRIAR
jgi:SAM-dependent methyltransferase